MAFAEAALDPPPAVIPSVQVTPINQRDITTAFCWDVQPQQWVLGLVLEKPREGEGRKNCRNVGGINISLKLIRAVGLLVTP